MRWVVVVKDIEEGVGWIYERFENRREAEKWMELQKEQLETEYYDIFLAMGED